MYAPFSYGDVLASSQKAAWQLDDVLPDDAELDFTRPFLPEALARAGGSGLPDRERLLLNQIRAHEYLALFGLVEEFILPFVLDHARPLLNGDDLRVRALLQFAGEEAKHIHLFRRFADTFSRGFGESCPVIGPAEAIGRAVMAHAPLSVALVILHIEWMTQAHYRESVHADRQIEARFKSLLRHHWMEEAQHARLDTLMVEALAEGLDAPEIEAGFRGYLDIVDFLDGGLAQQAVMNVAVLERRIGALAPDSRERLVEQQHQASRWTFLGSGMAHPRFRQTLARLSTEFVARLDAIAPAYA